MPDIQSTLTRKVGPLPVWGWAAVAGGLASVIYLGRKGSSGATAAAGAQPNVPYVPSPIIVTPQNMPDGTSSANAPPPASSSQQILIADSTANPNSGSAVGIPSYSVTSAATQPISTGMIANGTPLTPTGQTVQAKWGTGTNNFIQVTWLGGTTWVSQSDVRQSTGSGGAGARSSVMSFIPGSGGGKVLRHSSPHIHHQFLGLGGMGGGGDLGGGPWAQDPRRGLAVPQGQNVVGGMGGGAGRRAMTQVSQRTGIPMLRLMATNPGHFYPRRRRPNFLHLR